MKERYITVPKNKEAEKALGYDDTKSDQLLELSIGEEIFIQLWEEKLFHIINKINESNIDDFEDEIIKEPYKMTNTVKYLQNNMHLFSDEIIDFVKLIIDLFKEAVKKDTGIYFYF